MFTTAAAGLTNFAASLASLGSAILMIAVVVSALIIATSVGGQGIQKPVRQLAITLGICALILKGYVALVTGTMALF